MAALVLTHFPVLMKESKTGLLRAPLCEVSKGGLDLKSEEPCAVYLSVRPVHKFYSHRYLEMKLYANKTPPSRDGKRGLGLMNYKRNLISHECQIFRESNQKLPIQSQLKVLEEQVFVFHLISSLTLS